MTTSSGGEQPNPTTERAERVDVERSLFGGATYRGLGEQRLSESEERFERRRRTAGFFLAPLATVVVFLLPLDIPETQHVVAAVMAGVIVAWVTEPIPIPVSGLIGAALLVLMGLGGDEGADAVLAPFGSGTVFTFIGAFILAQAMLRHGLARRFAFRILSIPGVTKSTNRVIIAFGLITALISGWISNTATVAMLLPTAVGILGVVGELHPGQVRVRGAPEGLRRDEDAGRLRDDADAGVRRQRRRSAHPGRQSRRT